MTRFVTVLLLALLSAPFAGAALDIPPELKPWRGWALHGAESVDCPFFAGDTRQRHCAWPGRLELVVDGNGARFAVDVRVYAETWVRLPGDATLWPQDVASGGSPLPVVLRAGTPQARLTAGTHRLTGALRWEKRPESIAMGTAGALVQLTVDGSARNPLVDDAGQLWFGRTQKAAEAAGENNTVVTRVFRHLADGVPPMLTTRVELDVAGEDREILLGRALPEGFAPVALHGALPARLEPDGNLRIQVRAGRWEMTLEARQAQADAGYRTGPAEGAWPVQELWVFAADHRLRTVTPEGAPSVDPRQTGLPEEWQSLPAYLLENDTVLRLRERVRGDANPQPEPLVLRRELWLDFEGGALTARDRLNGELERSGRLAFAPGAQPGRVSINGQPQVITTLPDSAGEAAGIEVRPGPLQLEAISRVSLAGALAATGWSRDVQELSATLHLPPGWTLFAATGMDRAHPSWVSGWTLWDIFLVLVLTVAVARLVDRRVAALMLLTLLLTQDIKGAPLFLWLNLVAALAVWRVLPEGRLHKAVNVYRYLSVGLLAVVALLFAVDQVRQGLYPELEYPWRDIHAPVPVAQPAPAAPMEADVFAEAGAPDMQALEETKAVRSMAVEPVRQRMKMLAGSVTTGKAPVYAPVDPGVRVQTGPGVPDWRWNAVTLRWDGPVSQAQQVELWLVGPTANRALCFLRVLLVAALILALWQGRLPTRRLPAQPLASLALALSVGLLAGVAPQQAGAATAAMPDTALLTELRNRLTAAPDCVPSCAAIAAVHVDAAAGRLTLRLRVSAMHRVALPLPSASAGWRPRSVLLDGRPAPVLAQGGGLAVALEAGVHEVLLEGVPADAMTFAFPLPPGRVTVAAPGWQVGGVVDGRLAGDSLELKRARDASAKAADKEKKLLNEPEPAFVIVERTLRLDIDWQVETRVRRVAPSSAPLSVAIPLLPGETVNSRVNLKDGRVLVSLAQGQYESGWQSGLATVPQLVLAAGGDGSWVERWTLEASTRWHVEAEGVPPVKGAGGTAWYPWPGETLTLAISRPQALVGDTLTLEKVRLEHSPGHRVANSTLALTLLSSEGGDWRFPLPEGATLERIEIDGQSQVLAGDGREAVIPLHPGEQNVLVVWRTGSGMGAHARTPALQFDRPVSNLDIVLNIPAERWPLFAGGPGAGPAVLYWGVLLVVVLVALALARVPSSPLRTHEWLLLGIGMSSTMLPWTLALVAWFFLLAARGRMDPARWQPGFFNFSQVMLALFTLLALGVLFSTVPQSLILGNPDMQIAGNGSHAGMLHWFVDRTDGDIAQGWLVSLPMWAYRLLMLAWSLWLALALVRWLKWGWQQYSAGAMWISSPKVQGGDRAYVDENAGVEGAGVDERAGVDEQAAEQKPLKPEE